MKASHLARIGSRYYFRIRTPKDLLGYFPSPFIKISLKTSQYHSAISLVRFQLSKVERVFTLLRSGLLTQEQNELLLKEIPGKTKKPVQQQSNTCSNHPLSQVIALYCKDCKTAGKWTPKTGLEMEGMFNFFLSVIGDREISTIKRQDLISFRETLLKIPTHIKKRKEYRDKSLSEILQMENKYPMSASHINKYLVTIATMFKWALRNSLINVNYAEGLALSKKSIPEEEREKYSDSDLQRLSKALQYNPKKPERFWIPLISLYSGMRLSEVCQLHTEDIKTVEGVLCFDVNNTKDKSVKTTGSKRIVPIHSFLQALGFVKYVDSLRVQNKERLFENLTRKRNGYGQDLSKWFQRFNREFITENPKRVFHSFRHNVADSLKQQGVDDFIIAEILGHTHGSITMGRYGKRYQPQVLLAAIEKLDYRITLTPPTI